MEQKKVAIVSRIYQPETAAASFRLSALASALQEAGHKVEVLTVRPPRNLTTYLAADTTESTEKNIHISRFPVLRDKEGYVKGYLQYLSFDIPAFFRVLCSRADIFVVEPPPTTGFFVRLAAGIRRKPYIYYAADIWSDASIAIPTHSFVTTILRKIESFAFRGAQKVIAVSKEVAESVEELGGTAEIIRNGIDTEIFSADGATPTPAELEEKGIAPHYAVYAGTMSPWQGASIFIKSLNCEPLRNSDLHLIFMGRGDDVPQLKILARHLAPGRVHFFPPQPPQESARWQRGAVAGLVSIDPKSSYNFAYPTKFLASLSCGTSVCYAGSGPARAEIEQFQLGEVCSWSATEIAEKLAKILKRHNSRSDEDRYAETKRLQKWIIKNHSTYTSAATAAALVTQEMRQFQRNRCQS